MKNLVKLFSRMFLVAGPAIVAVDSSVSIAAEHVYITEFMAANTRSLLDRDREHSDWIELHNAGTEAVNLEGWALTDNRAQLGKWKFPAVVIGPNEFLIVFASEKGRRNPGAELHTNFKLSAEGEFLALVKPDGKTVVSGFPSGFPPQVADASYGLAMAGSKLMLVGPHTSAKVLVASEDIGMSWLTENYKDSTWLATTNAVGFDSDGSYASSIGLNLRSRMQGKSSSALIRIPFVVPSGGIDNLQLRMRYDDGFVAYLNGWEVARSNAPATLSWNSKATGEHGSSAPLSSTETFDGAAARYWTTQVNPTSRPRQHPIAPNSTNHYLRLVNGQTANQLNAVAFPALPVQQFDALSIEFKYRYTGRGEGTERLSFMLIPTSVHGVEGSGVKFESMQNLREPNLPGVFAVQILHNPENGQNALTVHWDGTKRFTTEISASAFPQRQFHRAQLRFEEKSGGVELSVILTPVAGGTTQPTHNAVGKLVIPGMKLGGQRVQFIGRIGNWDQTLDIDDLQLEATGAGGLIPDEFDLSPHLSALRPGTNLLCIHGLNRSSSDSSFLISSELFGGMSAVRTNLGYYMAEPTPGSANRQGVSAVAPRPVFAVRGGVFNKTATAELATKEGTIRYTTDGSEPSAASPLYASPLAITRTTLLKAKTFLPDTLPSATAAETFTIVDDQVASTSSNLPLILINTFGRYISPNNKSGASIQFINKREGRYTVFGPADYNGRVAINLRGYSTLRQPKNSMTIRLKDENDDKVKASLFGLPKDSDWVLYAPYSDKTLIRDALAYELSNAMGQYAPRTRFVEVYLDRNGGTLGQSDYMGVFVLIERVRIGKSRVNIETLGPDENQEPEISGGYLFKRDHSERYEPSFRTGRGNRFFYVEPKGNEISRDQAAWLSRYVNQFEQSLYGSDFSRPDRGYARYLDVNSFIDQHWLIEMSKNIDGFRYSAYVHKDRGGKLRMGPAWDWNLSFGNADYHEGYDPKGWYTELLRDSEICWFRRLSEDPEFMQQTIDRWGELRQSVLARNSILKRVDEMAAELEEAQARNFRRWPLLGRSVHPNYFVGKTYREEIDWMKQWITRRLDWIDNQFIAPPTLKTGSGKTATLSSPSGRIYYTTDSTDPRSRGGTPSPKAMTYKDAISMGSNATIFARVFHRDQWSSPVKFPRSE